MVKEYWHGNACLTAAAYEDGLYLRFPDVEIRKRTVEWLKSYLDAPRRFKAMLTCYRGPSRSWISSFGIERRVANWHGHVHLCERDEPLKRYDDIDTLFEIGSYRLRLGIKRDKSSMRPQTQERWTLATAVAMMPAIRQIRLTPLSICCKMSFIDQFSCGIKENSLWQFK